MRANGKSVAAILLVATALAGCGHPSGPISAVPAGYPKDEAAVIRCDELCVSIYDSNHDLVARKSDVPFSSSKIGEVTVVPGAYFFVLETCPDAKSASGKWSVKPVSLEAGKRYRIVHSALQGKCYADVGIEPEAEPAAK